MSLANSSSNIESSKLVVKEAFSYELFCEVDFSSELNSTIQWFYNNLLESNTGEYSLNNVTVENDGDTYECKYNDTVDSDSVEISLDVQCEFLVMYFYINIDLVHKNKFYNLFSLFSVLTCKITVRPTINV